MVFLNVIIASRWEPGDAPPNFFKGKHAVQAELRAKASHKARLNGYCAGSGRRGQARTSQDWKKEVTTINRVKTIMITTVTQEMIL